MCTLAASPVALGRGPGCLGTQGARGDPDFSRLRGVPLSSAPHLLYFLISASPSRACRVVEVRAVRLAAAESRVLWWRR